jgi:kynurenine formamidase
MLIDVSHEIEAGMITYRGLPGPVISDFLSRENSKKNYAPGVEFQIGRIDMVANTGTYVDSPFHRFAEGIDLAGLPLTSLCNLNGMIVRADQTQRAIDAEQFRNRDIKNKAVLIHTGWDRNWRTEQYSEKSPYLTKAAAEFLANAGAIMVGIDSFNIDDTGDLNRPVHSILLAARIPVVEHLCNLAEVPETGFRFFAVPPKVKGLGTFPVRAYCLVS